MSQARVVLWVCELAQANYHTRMCRDAISKQDHVSASSSVAIGCGVTFYLRWKYALGIIALYFTRTCQFASAFRMNTGQANSKNLENITCALV